MLDLLILHPRLFWHVDRPMICNGALTLASYLAQEGFAVRLIDDNTPYKRYSLRGLQKAAEELAPRAVGISVGAMNALRSYELAAALKQAMPHVLLLGGGMHSYDAAHEMIEQSFDIVVRGEAERAMVPLLQLIREAGDRARPEGWMADRRFTERLRGIRGLVFREDGELRDTGPVELLEDLDDLPQLNFGLANIDDYVRSKTDIDQVYSQFCFQRGCPFRCTFCKSKGMPSRVRSNSTRYMIDALRHRHEAYGVKRVFLFDSNFAMPRERARDFAEQMIKTDLP
ncbi:MAG: cobalamin-dependent protein, partial [Kiritimatiellae bacterium]|nr:cobalamin-dependent protein [Kiritimatiellia bacterium]